VRATVENCRSPRSSLLRLTALIIALALLDAGKSAAQPTWTELPTVGASVPGREGPSAVYDSASNRLIVFGGISDEEPCCNNSLNETWVLINANGTGGTPTWIQLTPSAPSGLPGARTDLSAVYDSANNRMIIFGGGQFGPSVFHALFNDVWVLTHANGLGGTATWMPLAPVGGPPPARAGHEAVYDAMNNRMIVYGGGNNGIEDVPTDVWVLTNANGFGGTPTWLQFSPQNGAPVEEHYATGYDPNTNRMIFFGGCCYWSNASWVLANANGLGGSPQWLQLSPGGTLPALRQTPAYGYNPTNNSLLIFGSSGPGGAYNDTWELSNANGAAGAPQWTNLIPDDATGSPPIVPGFNTSSASGYDATNQRLISLENTPVSGGGAVLQAWVLAMQSSSSACGVTAPPSINTSFSNGVVDATLTPSDSPCQYTLTLHNKKNYWTNFQVTTIGSVTAVPIPFPPTNTNPYAKFNLLPPSSFFPLPAGEDVSYTVTFSKRGDGLSIFADPTSKSGHAIFMNFVQGFLNLVPLGGLPTLAIDEYEQIANAFPQMPHLQAATTALFTNPPFAHLGSFVTNLAEFALSPTEMLTFENLMVVLQVNIGVSAIEGTLGTPFRLLNSFVTSFGNIYTLTFQYPSGSIQLTAQ